MPSWFRRLGPDSAEVAFGSRVVKFSTSSDVLVVSCVVVYQWWWSHHTTREDTESTENTEKIMSKYVRTGMVYCGQEKQVQSEENRDVKGLV